MIIPLEELSAPILMFVPEAPDVQPPFRKNADDSGYDVHAYKFVKMMVSPMGVGEFEEVPDPDTGVIPGAGISADEIILNPGERVLISAGYSATVRIPSGFPSWLGFDISICSRSGTPYKEGLVVANQPGTVDVSYRGSILVAIANIGKMARRIKKGDRIAQLVVRPVLLVDILKTDVLPAPGSDRGDKGFGSSGKR